MPADWLRNHLPPTSACPQPQATVLVNVSCTSVVPGVGLGFGVGMVVAQIGLGLAVIKPDTYAVVVFMAVASTIITPLLLKIAFREPDASGYLEAPVVEPAQ